MMKTQDTKNLIAALDWYQMAGIDVIVADQHTDWFEISKRPPTATSKASAPRFSPSTAGAQKTAPKVAPKVAVADHTLAAPKTDQAVLEAREKSAMAQTIDELQAAVAQFDGCSLKNMAKNTCFADGNPQSSIMLIGEAPGRDEDLQGRPFVGRAGQLLDKMLQAAQLERQKDVWITNTVFWRPPGNRNPSSSETEICRPFLERQIDLIKPSIIVALGGTATKSLLQTSSGIMRLRGKWHKMEVAGQSYILLPTLHPSYLLRTPAAKKLAWHDLLMIKEKLQETKS